MRSIAGGGGTSLDRCSRTFIAGCYAVPHIEMPTRAALLWTVVAAIGALQTDPGRDLGDAVAKLTRASTWKLVRRIPLAFPTHHPQGMVKIGETFYVSSVEVTVPTKRFTAPQGAYDRDEGRGIGHLFKVSAAGLLVAGTRLGEGAIYHPGGIDYDGASIWVAVAEYRPDSRSIVYRIDPATLTAKEVFRWADHLGAVVHDTEARELHGVSWGSRRVYRWRMDRGGRVRDAAEPPERLRTMNPAHYVDYQDCKYAGRRRMLCTGVAELRPTSATQPFRLGGLELVDLRTGRPLHQVPIPLWTSTGLDMTHNPSWFERTATGIRGYFMPEDDSSAIYVYDVDVD